MLIACFPQVSSLLITLYELIALILKAAHGGWSHCVHHPLSTDEGNEARD